MIIPKAFISYSHDTLEHKKWILELATRLRNNGIDAILDQFELQPGDDVPHLMEKTCY
jgi:TIR domain